MLRISCTHIQGLHSTQVRYLTQIDLLTCRVCFFKHMMISTQVRHYTHLDLTTCRVCSVKQGRAASGGVSAPEPPRAHWSGPESGGAGRGVCHGSRPPEKRPPEGGSVMDMTFPSR